MRVLFFVALLSASALAAGPPPPSSSPTSGIVVTGEGQVQVVPDRAVVALAVETNAPSADAASRENADRMQKVMQAVKGQGVPSERIRTGNYQLFPMHPAPDQPQQRGPESFRATNTVEVTIDDPRGVGKIIDAALASGANRVESVQFELRDPTTARQQAIERAVQQAQQQAQVMARSLGVQLGPLREASTGAPSLPPPQPMAMEARGAAASTPIEPGEQTFTATVTLVYEVAQATGGAGPVE